ncbi:hypothetical protein KEM48_004356 [Puccinia striiformis f. sp. tritici PST-130]|nr:hypothetical protein KEM48_004356 [Puccinia striiformis f. sp. tritici PST-130]
MPLQDHWPTTDHTYIDEAQSTSSRVKWRPGLCLLDFRCGDCPGSSATSWTFGRGNQVESGAFKPQVCRERRLDSGWSTPKFNLSKTYRFSPTGSGQALQGTPTKNTGRTIERLPVCQSFGEYKDTGSGSLGSLSSLHHPPQKSSHHQLIPNLIHQSSQSVFLNLSSHTQTASKKLFHTRIHFYQNKIQHSNMLAIQTLSLVAFLASASAYDLPLTMMSPTPTTAQLTARSFFPAQFIPGQLSGGEHTAGTISAGAGPASASCGLEVNVFGVDVFEFNFYSALAASISAHGVSASQCSVLQSAIEGDLLRLAAGSKTSASCTAACKADERCDSCSFDNGVCQIKAVDYVKQNHAGAPLAQAFQGLYSNGGSGYCSICPADRSCSGPKPSGLPRRSIAAEDYLINEKCPTGLSACPISSGMTAKPSAGFECLDLQQEVTSCGGCASTGQGVDCTTMKGVSSAGAQRENARSMCIL